MRRKVVLSFFDASTGEYTYERILANADLSASGFCLENGRYHHSRKLLHLALDMYLDFVQDKNDGFRFHILVNSVDAVEQDLF